MKKKGILTVLFVLILVLFTGCGKPETPEEIWQAYQEAARGLTCTQTDMTMELGLSMELPAAGSYHRVNLDMSMEGTTVITQEPFASQTNMTMDMHYYSPEVDMDQNTKLDSVVYTVTEENQLVSYTETMGMWVRAETGMNPEELMKNADTVIGTAGITFQKDETVTEWEGKPAVCLTATITGDAVQSMMDTAMEGLTAAAADEMDFSALTGHTRIYISTETYLPLAQEMTMEGVGEVLGAMGDSYMDIDFNTCTATIRYRSFDPQPPIELPQEARDNAIDWEE